MTRRLLTAAVLTAGLVLTAAPAHASERGRQTQPKPGEGLIAVTARVCGSSATWRQTAAANGIRGPRYLVRLGRAISVPCAASRNASRPVAGVVAPLTHWRVTSCYGMRWGRLHAGVDLAAPWGTPIRAVAAGTVVRAGWIWSGYGISVVIRHGSTFSHYAHLSSERVAPGQNVRAGQQIGRVGATGHATGPHLHLELARAARVIGAQFNPAPWLRARGIRIGGC